MTRRYQGALVVCALLIGYASLYPFVPIRLPGEDAVVAFFLKPRYLVGFDIGLNMLAYVPLGALACYRFRQLGRRHPVAWALALAASLSFALEVCQLFVPFRVASTFDILANVAGAAVGASAFLEPMYSVVSRPLGEMRDRLFTSSLWGDAGLVLIVLWLLAQLNPALPFFGAGNIVEEGRQAESQMLQGIGAGFSILAFALFVSVLMRGVDGSLRMTLVLLSLALWLKFLSASLMLKPHFSDEWVSSGRVAGLIAGTLAFIPVRRLGRLARIYLAILAMLAGALFAKIFGSYSAIDELLRVFSWPHGQLAGFATLTRFLHELWPFAALVFLIGFFFHTRKISTLLERTQVLQSRDFR